MSLAAFQNGVQYANGCFLLRAFFRSVSTPGDALASLSGLLFGMVSGFSPEIKSLQTKLHGSREENPVKNLKEQLLVLTATTALAYKAYSVSNSFFSRSFIASFYLCTLIDDQGLEKKILTNYTSLLKTKVQDPSTEHPLNPNRIVKIISVISYTSVVLYIGKNTNNPITLSLVPLFATIVETTTPRIAHLFSCIGKKGPAN
jgi:hypothetical protein